MGILDFMKKRESCPVTAEVTERLMGYRICAMQGIGTRQQQEDSFGLINAPDVTKIKNEGLLAVVADGMGGLSDGKVASETAFDVLSDWFDTLDRHKDICIQLEEGIKAADRAVANKCNGMGGTTVIACLLYSGDLYFASVGDSFLYLRRNNRLFRLNTEHNYRKQLYRKIIEDGSTDTLFADTHPDSDKLTQFVGMGTLENIDMLYAPMPLMNGDTLLIASDGVGGVLDESVLLDCLSLKTPEEACRVMENHIAGRKAVHQDNYTAVVIKCEY